LLTNNPDKIEGLRSVGVNVVARLPLETQLNPENADYLLAKQNRMHHILSLSRDQGEQPEERSSRGDD
jgi:GTP cyclohydrolase II